jgi:hypothetical protein
MTISVTMPMILFGSRCNGAECPLAKAFAAAGFPDVMVVSDHVDFYDHQGDVCATFPLPPAAQRFLKAFDRHILVQPFVFEMPALQPGVQPFTHFQSVPVV